MPIKSKVKGQKRRREKRKAVPERRTETFYKGVCSEEEKMER